MNQRILPPLTSLKGFEAAVRHGSFSHAADELGITQGAISKQIRVLEEFLGVMLFHRRHHQLILTEEGQFYFPAVKSALDTMAVATAHLTQLHNPYQTLNVNILPSLSTRWLIPRIAEFNLLHPGIALNITTGDGPVDFTTSPVDIAIRAGRNDTPWPKQCAVLPLMGEELVPVCSPELKKGKHPIRAPKDLVHHTLLKHTTRPGMWREYLDGIGEPAIQPNDMLGFEHFFMLIRAAKEKLGVGLAPRFLVQGELDAGRLIIPFRAKFASPYRYYFLCPKQKETLPTVRKFRAWLESIVTP